MHIAYTGPKLLRIDAEGYPVQPYGIQDNPHSILDVADIVYIDPVNTGFSRIIGDAARTQFFGVNEDITYLAKWVDNFVTRAGRLSIAQARALEELGPKFMIEYAKAPLDFEQAFGRKAPVILEIGFGQAALGGDYASIAAQPGDYRTEDQ